jgi:sigma-B regulation protein RsbU (phosphoserine phosphatase)
MGLGDGIIGYFTADVGGHDLGAAYITSALKALLRQNFSLLYTPVETMTLLNSVLRSVLSEGVVLCACCMRLNRRSGQMVVVSAGHPPLIQIPAQGQAVLHPSEGDLLGAFESPYFQSLEIHVSAGDRLLLFSDGLIETYRGEPVTRGQGLQRLMDTASERRLEPLAVLVEETALAICPAAGKSEDDILLLGVEV